MAPPQNTRRRNALADAAIEILGTAGIHKLSHRAVDEQAGVPPGTASNYFPRRDDLLEAAARPPIPAPMISTFMPDLLWESISPR